LQGSQLVAEGQVLEDDVVVATAGQGDRPQEQQCQCNHVLILSGVAAESNPGSATTSFWILANDRHELCVPPHPQGNAGGA
jgi:hypothetical protein